MPQHIRDRALAEAVNRVKDRDRRRPLQPDEAGFSPEPETALVIKQEGPDRIDEETDRLVERTRIAPIGAEPHSAVAADGGKCNRAGSIRQAQRTDDAFARQPPVGPGWSRGDASTGDLQKPLFGREQDEFAARAGLETDDLVLPQHGIVRDHLQPAVHQTVQRMVQRRDIDGVAHPVEPRPPRVGRSGTGHGGKPPVAPDEDFIRGREIDRLAHGEHIKDILEITLRRRQPVRQRDEFPPAVLLMDPAQDPGAPGVHRAAGRHGELPDAGGLRRQPDGTPGVAIVNAQNRSVAKIDITRRILRHRLAEMIDAGPARGKIAEDRMARLV